MAIKLTPETLRRLVLEEKQKMTMTKEKMMDPKAMKEMGMEMDEDWPGTKSMHSVKQTPGKKLQTMKMIKEAEADLRNRLRKLQERRLALRRQIINDLD